MRCAVKIIFHTWKIGKDVYKRQPFYRGEEVSGDVIDSEYFVGYEFKKYLLEIQQAVIIYCMIH